MGKTEIDRLQQFSNEIEKQIQQLILQKKDIDKKIIIQTILYKLKGI